MNVNRQPVPLIVSRRVRKVLPLLNLGMPQVCIRFRSRRDLPTLEERARSRGYELHDRCGDLLIFRKFQTVRKFS